MAGVLGSGTQFFMTDSTDYDTEITPLLSINRPNLSVDVVETTNHGSSNRREYIAGLADPGEITATVLYQPGTAVDTYLLTTLAARGSVNFKISVVETDGTKQDVTGTMIMTGYETDDSPVDGRREATITGKVTGATSQAAQ